MSIDRAAVAGAERMARWRAAIVPFGDRQVLAVLALGFSSGLPLALTFGTLTVWMAEVGVSKASIGLFASVGTPYALKFLWAPLIDRMSLPVLTRVFGRRRGWMLFTQALLIASILALGMTDPGRDPGITAICALIVAFCSASQDIVIDAYRVEILEPRLLPSGATSVQFGYRIAMLVSGAGALYLASALPWSTVYAIMAALVVVGVAVALAGREPAAGASESQEPEGAAAWFERAVLQPFVEFARRPGWAGVLLFVVFFKLGDAFAGVMTNPFLIDLGFSKIDIANVVKVFGFGATMLGLVAGGVLINVVGLRRALWITGFLQLATNLVFVAQAEIGADLAFLALTIALENLAGGMGSAVFVAYISGLTNISFTATQYALLSSLAVAGRTWLSTPSGYIAEATGWAGFFFVSAAVAIPGLIMLYWLMREGARTRIA
jgi:PAT family beta-lactamase induction signal transducer AmpG